MIWGPKMVDFLILLKYAQTIKSTSLGPARRGPAGPPGPRHLPAGFQNGRFPHGPKMVDLIAWIYFEIDHGGNRP